MRDREPSCVRSSSKSDSDQSHSGSLPERSSDTPKSTNALTVENLAKLNLKVANYEGEVSTIPKGYASTGRLRSYWPTSASRELWHFAIKVKLAQANNTLSLGYLLLEAVHTMPGRLSLFNNTFANFAVSPPSGQRLRDLLPLPLPSLALVTRWRDALGARNKSRNHRSLHLQPEIVARDIWTYLIIMAYNYEYCGRLGYNHWAHRETPSLAQAAVLDNVSSAVRYFVGQPGGCKAMPVWAEVIQKRSVDYSGDEVCHALPIRYNELISGLPDPELAASVAVESLIGDELRDWLFNPYDHLLPKDQWPEEVPKAVVQVESAEEYSKICVHLVKCGILSPIDYEDIFEVNGVKVLNGMFAVEKKGAVPSNADRVTRLIMNLVPGNSYQKLLTDSLGSLHSSTSWTSIRLPDGHVLLWSSDDQKGAFYVFRLPKQWRGLMAFTKTIPGYLIGSPKPRVYLAASVIPMGWISAVSLFQHLQRKLSLGAWPMGASLPSCAEWRRDGLLPMKSGRDEQKWFQNYLDDFDAPIIVKDSEAGDHMGIGSDMLYRKRAANELHGIYVSDAKAALGVTKLERMGAYIDGETGRVGLSVSKLLELGHFGLWLLSSLYVDSKGLTIFLGRLIRAFEFRRPLMGLLNDIWQHTNWEGRVVLRVPSVCEILMSLCMLPMAFTNLRAHVDSCVSCADASLSGGGMCISVGLAQSGVDTLTGMHSTEGQSSSPALEHINSLQYTLTPTPRNVNVTDFKVSVNGFARILCIGLFDGLGGLRIALNKLVTRCCVVGYVSCEVDKHAKRLVRKRWPGVIEWGDITLVNREMVSKLGDMFCNRVDLVLIGAGSPCQDLSALNAHRLGLAGSQSSLFYQIPRIVQYVKACFPGKVHFFVENVFSMAKVQVEKFNSTLGTTPYMIDAGDFSDAYRKRLYWTTWCIGTGPDRVSTHKGHYIEVKLFVQKKPCGWWLDKHGWWSGNGSMRDILIPTLTRALPSKKPMRNPAGLAQASPVAIARWKADDHCFQVYNYEDHHMVWDTARNEYRLPSANECEMLMGIGRHYTLGAVKEHFDSRATFVIRRQLIGNTFNCCVISFLVSELLTLHYLCKPVALSCHLAVDQYDIPFNEVNQSGLPIIKGDMETQIVKEYLNIAERGGSDIRLELGIPFRALAWPRAGARTHHWIWEIVNGYPWRSSEEVHINKLELLATFNTFKWRTRNVKQQHSRILHLVDSQVVGAILTRGRTSSRLLRSTVRRFNTLVLAADLYPAFAFVSSEDNPADLPSRWQYIAKKRRAQPYQNPASKRSVKRKEP